MPEPWSIRKRSLPVTWILGITVIFIFGVISTPALAHRIIVFAFAEGDTIQVEGKFVPDTPVRQGRVLILDAKTGKELLTGQTDDQGKFSFKVPAAAAAEKMDLKIVVEASMGHRGEWLLKAGSYLPGAASGQAAKPAPAVAPAPKAPGTQVANVDQQALEAALNKVLERQLAPIKEKLTELTIHRTSLTDVIGGLGYIMGIFGLWAYFQSKKGKDA